MNKRVNSKRILFGVILAIFLLAFFIGALYIGKYESDNSVVRDVVSRYGYLGVFVISFISGFNLAVPVPAISFVFGVREKCGFSDFIYYNRHDFSGWDSLCHRADGPPVFTP